MHEHANLIKKVSFLCQTDKIVFSCRKYWLPPTRTWISNVICHGLFCVQWFEVKGGCATQIFSMSILWEVIVCFVDIDGIVDHHCLNFLFINMNKIRVYDITSRFHQMRVETKIGLSLDHYLDIRYLYKV